MMCGRKRVNSNPRVFSGGQEITMSTRLTRWTGIGGVLFFVALAAAIFQSPNAPDSTASAAKVVKYYGSHKNSVTVNVYITEVAVVIAVIFFWYVREYVSSVPENRRLANLGFAGALLLAASGGLSGGFEQALVNGIKHFDPGSMQLLNALSEDATNILGAIGVAILLGATGLVAIRSRVLPQWLGWVSVVIAVASLVISFIGLAGVGLWSLITGILLIIRASRQPSTPTTATPSTEWSATPTTSSQ
jgi:hypothetical protein